MFCLNATASVRNHENSWFASVYFQFSSARLAHQSSSIMPKQRKSIQQKYKKKIKSTKTSKKARKITKESSAVCELCGQKFSKLANLKTHIEKKHKGLRWICPICDAEQVTKFSHVRHYNKVHSDAPPIDADANMRYTDGSDHLPEKAKDSVIQNLQESNKVLKALAVRFRKGLLAKIVEIMDLKAKLHLDIEAEKNEYNTLNGSFESDSESENSMNSNESSGKAESLIEDTSDSDDENSVSSKYPESIPSEDPLKHFTESDTGAGSSKL